jgi:hypothetical protein
MKVWGRRYEILTRDAAEFDLALKLRGGAASFGEVYSFISGLYFRGKMAYVARFASRALVIVAGRGLVAPETIVTMEELRAIANIDIHEQNQVYLGPLLRDAARIDSHVVLLGSIASDKYTRPLLDIFGDRLLFPEAFVGRGDMSRGGLMLRCAASGEELSYIPVRNAVRRGVRPPRLEKINVSRISS